MAHNLWGLPTYCIVTGASQGIGACISVEFARKFGRGSLILLLARSTDGLNKTKQLINEANSDVLVQTCSVDLSRPNAQEFESIVKKSLEEHKAKPSDFTSSIIVHNAGSVGDIREYCANMSDVKKMENYFSLNMFSVMCLNSQFLSIFNEKPSCSRLIVNITSICAIQPLKSMGYYCIGKASREMYFRVLAEEDNSLRVLSYSPGPVNTDMISHVASNVLDDEVRKMFVSLKDSNSVLSVDQTVRRLIAILDRGNFKSGTRIDYYDDSD